MASVSERQGSVMLSQGQAASSVLHEIVLHAAERFPETFNTVGLPASAEALRKTYPLHLPAFEAARLNSTDRRAIAAHLVARLNEQVHWYRGDDSEPLAQAFDGALPPLPLQTHQFDGTQGWQPEIVYRGQRWRGQELLQVSPLMADRGLLTAQAAMALDWVSSELMREGRIDLSGRKIALLGAGAEMAPTRHWLEAGAEVLWLDTVPPPQQWREREGMSGRLVWTQQPIDLLTMPPAQILATLIEFAAGEPIDLGLYAYAPGQMRELRLTALMNALVDAMPEQLLSSVTMLVSPTTPTALEVDDLAAMARRREQAPFWEHALAALRLLGRGDGAARVGQAAATRTVVGIQGVSYQVAQYIGKVLAAERWHDMRGFRVSANTAAITRTRSMSNPVFAAAFEGAAAFGVETLTPRQSRCLNGLLALHDWLHPQVPVPGAVRVHGGIHTLPYPLEAALRVAAVIGFARAPRLLRGLVSR